MESRQRRNRLARRRPAPDRVRRRISNEQPTRGWLRRLPWAHIGAVIGVLAAIGSLLFTGIATYYGAEVAKDQLNQSIATTEDEKRKQAALVTFWLEDEGGIGLTLHVMNRSFDPVSDVLLTATVARGGYHTYNFHEGYISHVALPPCSEFSYMLSDMTIDDDGDKKGDPIIKGHEWIWRFDVLKFVDGNGISWSRTKSGLYSELPPDVRSDWEPAEIITPTPTVKRADNCAEANGEIS